MKGTLRACRVLDNVYWVGALDWNSRDFHGYQTPRGTTYNAFLILADKITLIDTVKAPFYDDLMGRIASIIDPTDIDYIISNHTEMDHSGCLPRVIEAVHPEKVFASAMGVKGLSGHFGSDLPLTAVKDGEVLDIGGRTISFLETRMLHWPDSMFTYLSKEKVLFSSDAFGMHLASSARFADEIDPSILTFEGEKYFANILLPYSNLVTKLIGKVAASGLDISHILPDHGPLWRTPEDIQRVIDSYAAWAEQRPSKRALILYDTMWMSTDAMARAIAEGVTSGGGEVLLRSMKASHRSDVAKDILDCGALLVGSPTLNNGLYPSIADVMTYLKGLKPRNLIGAAFGSHGWSGEAVGLIETYLDDMHIPRIAPGIAVQYVPDADTLERCFSLGHMVAEQLTVNA